MQKSKPLLARSLGRLYVCAPYGLHMMPIICRIHVQTYVGHLVKHMKFIWLMDMILRNICESYVWPPYDNHMSSFHLFSAKRLPNVYQTFAKHLSNVCQNAIFPNVWQTEWLPPTLNPQTFTAPQPPPRPPSPNPLPDDHPLLH